ncbi:(d)CMP kinase [Alicyclobacillus mengziensis]|uniref:Cytidylate kinase n=1 Tax=Alicyclobacillus mengziensis TaxID=2931921 RepID=A0A9X7VVP8_9BACL|nr:(d)CMP kinase [Alicyclobacillus mengziensis]QSO45745.1 (d)CMP kinase [Alicyclobacillus mengziensis]
MVEHVSIAIDGPAGAGKSTVARIVAKRLGLLYVDTGAMYRSVAWLAVRFGVRPSDELGLTRLLDEYLLGFERDPALGTLVVRFQNQDITPELRSPEVSGIVSQLSVHPLVRERLTSIQRSLRRDTGVVMDGRDIGTVVMPDADVKVFLTASLDERARRRAEEITAAQGREVSEVSIRKSMAERDARDSSRDVAPLRPAADAYILDSTGKSIDEVVDEILRLVRESVK